MFFNRYLSQYPNNMYHYRCLFYNLSEMQTQNAQDSSWGILKSRDFKISRFQDAQNSSWRILKPWDFQDFNMPRT